MPKIGIPFEDARVRKRLHFFSYTLAGPPEKMIPIGAQGFDLLHPDINTDEFH